MAKQQPRIILLAAISILTAVALGLPPVNASTDGRIDELFTALRDRRFSKATEHFDSTMKAALPADKLSAVWLQLVGNEDKLENWKIVKREKTAGTDVVTVELTFARGEMISTVSVRPESDEIAGLYFKPAAYPANGSTDSRVDELFTALRDSDFNKATAHFDSAMKAALSPDQLEAVWVKIVAEDGKLEKWKIVTREKMAAIDIDTVELTFERGKVNSTVSVSSESDEIAGLYFRPASTASTGSPRLAVN